MSDAVGTLVLDNPGARQAIQVVKALTAALAGVRGGTWESPKSIDRALARMSMWRRELGLLAVRGLQRHQALRRLDVLGSGKSEHVEKGQAASRKALRQRGLKAVRAGKR